MWKIPATAIIFCIGSHYAYQYELPDVKTSEPNTTYDILKFAQQWPVTVCKYWMPEEYNRTGCHLPKQKNRWTVHGIWPVKFDAQYNFCNLSWTFDLEQIKSIEAELEQGWISVYNEPDRYHFWRHEWLKHGTCATDLEPLNSQFKYFSKGLEWNQKYSLSDMLEAANLFPDDTKKVNPEDFVNAVMAKTGKIAQCGCYEVDGEMYLQELRICFDKQLNMIDCQKNVGSCGSSAIFPANV